jgi:hypothetical protein
VSWHKKKKSKRKSKIFFEKRGIQHSLAAKANWIRRPLHIQKQQVAASELLISWSCNKKRLSDFPQG